jgi:hypothetical protein
MALLEEIEGGRERRSVTIIFAITSIFALVRTKMVRMANDFVMVKVAKVFCNPLVAQLDTLLLPGCRYDHAHD